MAQTVIQNDTIRVAVDSHGAEMTSIQNAEGKEYLWDADPKYWKRHAPVLFPLVGSLKDGQYRLNGKTYFMGQHGFARDSEFQLLQASQTECWYRLTESEESLAVYPYPFTLDIGYRLGEQTVETIWKVTNSGTQPLYFSIGGHPAFLCPQTPEKQKSEYSLHFYQEDPLTLSLLNQGLLAKQTMETQHGFAKIGQHLFDVGTLILEDDQVKKVALVNPDGVEYITVTYEAPVVGVWSGSKNDTPFVCIEPWYGLADADNFTGTWEERKWGNCLEAGQVFEGGFTIRIK